MRFREGVVKKKKKRTKISEDKNNGTKNYSNFPSMGVIVAIAIFAYPRASLLKS
jgi:hypothetical protein